MQGKGITLRLGLLALVVVLVLSAVGSLSLARDAFDGNDYDDCPAATRLDSVIGLAVDRTDEEDEIRVSWEELSGTALSSLGRNGYRARLTVIVEGSGPDIKRNVALGDTSLVVDPIDFAQDLTISVAITLGDYVISDIAEKDFTSGMPPPAFLTTLKVAAATAAVDGVDPTAVGGEDTTHVWAADEDIRKSFYYLGFNDVFDNWFVTTPATVAGAGRFRTQPSTAKFRVGLAHGDGSVDAGAADFENYRIVIEDSSGDLLGYQAETVEASRTYGDKLIVIGAADEDDQFMTANDLTSAVVAVDDGDDIPERPRGFTNIRLSNRVTGDSALSPYFAVEILDALNVGNGVTAPDGRQTGLTYGNLFVNELGGALPVGALYAEAPVEYFDFPSDVFEDDGSYVVKAWAEDDDGTRISPVASIEISVREGDPVDSAYTGYASLTLGTVSTSRSWAENDEAGVELSVYGLSIQDE